MKKRFLWCLLFWGLTSISSSQELSTSVFPSEDELLEALNLGEIDLATYGTLQEIYLRGVDSSRLHELDDVPNLVYVEGSRGDLLSHLEIEQLSPLSSNYQPREGLSGTIRHKYYQYLDADNRSRYRTFGSVDLNRCWHADFTVQREYLRRERITYRSVRYCGGSSFVREVILGNFSRRLGLGTVFGYRGKLLTFSERLDRESLLYPDYGGYNGMFFSGRKGKLQMQGLFSHNRDTDFSHTALGQMVERKGERLSVGMLTGLNRLRNRQTGVEINDVKIGGHFSAEFKSGYNAAEVMVQSGDRSSWALVDEGWYRLPSVNWRYAFWAYGSDFLDLSSGSKTGGIYRTSTINDLEFDFSNRRCGQTGGLIKAIMSMSPGWNLESSVAVSVIDDDTLNLEMLWGLTREISGQWALRLDVLGKLRRQHTVDNARDDTSQRTRFEISGHTGNITIRSYVGYVSRTDMDDVVMLFATVRLTGRYGWFELWSNIGRYNIEAGRIDYFYGYVCNVLPLYDRLRSVIKLSHSYNREATNDHLTVVSVELEATF